MSCFQFLPCFPKKEERRVSPVAPSNSKLAPTPANPPKSLHPPRPGAKLDSAAENDNGTMVLVLGDDAKPVLAKDITNGDDASGGKAKLQDDAFLRSIFDKCDLNGDGQVSKIELIKLLRTDQKVADFFGLPKNIRQEDGTRDQMEAWFQRIDKDGDRFLTFDEFKRCHWVEVVKAMEPGIEECQTTNVQPPALADSSPTEPDAARQPEQGVCDVFDVYDSYLRTVFNAIDADRDGYITTKELTGSHEVMDMFASNMMTVGEGNVQDKVKEYVQLLDTDGDGRITFDEFRDCFKPKLQIVAP